MKEDLGQWIDKNVPRFSLTYKDQAIRQFSFVYERLWELRNEPAIVDIIATHFSKSINLPVYQFELDDKVITMRCNFHDWIMSVRSETVIEGLDTLSLFTPHMRLNPTQCEGMEELVYGSYMDNKNEFTIRLDNEYAVYCILQLISVAQSHTLNN